MYFVEKEKEQEKVVGIAAKRGVPGFLYVAELDQPWKRENQQEHPQ